MKVNSSEHPRKSVDITVEDSLKKIIRDTGQVTVEYGGFAIKILDHRRFPWYKVFDILVEHFDVWIEKKDQCVIIVTKQKID